MKRLFSLILILCLISSLAGCGDSSSADYSVSFALDGIPSSLDPQIASSRSELTVIYNTFEGLTRFNRDGSYSLAAAQSYSVSEDNLTYTFTLRSGAKWSDGEDVTAQDFVFGLRRAVKPETKCPTVENFFSIANAQSVYKGEADASELGVYSKGSDTVIITLSSPDNNLMRTLALAAAMPCREDFFESTSGKYGLSASNYISNGPFYVKRWAQDTESNSLRIVKSRDYNGSVEAKPASVVLYFNDTSDHITSVSEQQMNAAYLSASFYKSASSAKLNTEYNSDINYVLSLNSAAPVFATENMRRIFAASVDRDLIASKLTEGYEMSSSVVGRGYYCGEVKYEPCTDSVIKYDPSAADGYLSELEYEKALLEQRIAESTAESEPDSPDAAQADGSNEGYSDGTDGESSGTTAESAVSPYESVYPPWDTVTEVSTDFTLIYPEGGCMSEIATAIANCWEKAFGIVVNTKAMTEKELISVTSSGNYYAAVIPVYSTDAEAESIIRSFSSGSISNKYKYVNEEYDRLADAAIYSNTVSNDDEIRSAERYLISTGSFIPLVSGGSIIIFMTGVSDIYFAGTYGYIDFSSAVNAS